MHGLTDAGETKAGPDAMSGRLLLSQSFRCVVIYGLYGLALSMQFQFQCSDG